MARFQVPGRKEEARPVPAVSGGATPPAAAFGGVEARALQTVGETAQSLAGSLLDIEKAEEAREVKRLRAQKNNDKAAAANAFVISGGSYNDWELENFQNKGLSAQGMTTRYQTWQEEADRNTIDQLENDRQKEMYRALALERNINNAKRVGENEIKEVRAGQGASYQALMDAEVNNGITRFDSPDHITMAEDNIKIAAGAMADLEDLSQIEQDALVAKNLSIMHTANVERWAIDDAETARKYFETHKDKIDPTLYDELEKVMKVEKVVQDGGVLATEAMLQGETEGERLDWLSKNPVKDEATMKEARAQVRLQSKDKRDSDKRDAIIVNDNILSDAYRIRDAGGKRTDALSLAKGATSAAERKELETSINNIFKPVDAVPPDQNTDEYATHLTSVYQDIESGQYASLSQLRRNTLGRLTDADQTEVENHFQQGGLLGGISESAIQDAFFNFSGYSANDIPVTYQSARRIIVANVKALPPGRTTVNDTEIRQWMSDAVRGQADSGLIPTKESIGVTDQLTTAQRNNVISQMEQGNAERIKQGKTPYPINAETIARASENVYPRVKEVAPPVEPVIIAPVPVFGEELLTSEQIQAQVKETGQQITPETAKELEREQFPSEPVKTPESIFTTPIKGDTFKLTPRKQEFKKFKEPPRESFESALMEISAREGLIPDEIIDFETFKKAKALQLQRELTIKVSEKSEESRAREKLKSFTPKELDKFYREEYKIFVGKAIGELLTDK